MAVLFVKIGRVPLASELEEASEAIDEIIAVPSISKNWNIPENPWHAAVTNACVVTHIEWSDDAEETLKKLIEWEVKIALDPSVSKPARDLIEEGNL